MAAPALVDAGTFKTLIEAIAAVVVAKIAHLAARELASTKAGTVVQNISKTAWGTDVDSAIRTEVANQLKELAAQLKQQQAQ